VSAQGVPREGRSPRLGKVGVGEFERSIAPHLGSSRPEVLIGPGLGADAAVVKVGAGRVITVTTDPLSLIPALGAEISARLACRLLASDSWTTGIPPAYVSLSFHLPPDMPEATVQTYLAAMHAEWERLGVAVVAGHTGRYEGCDLTIVGAGTVIGVGDEGRYVGAPFVAAGDKVIVTKGCAIEATAVAAHLFPQRLAAKLEPEVLARAQALIEKVSVVEDCRALVQLGGRANGVSCLHDASEGGVLGAVVELARATGKDLRVEQDKIPLLPEARAACEVFGIDPYWTLSQGTLIATVSRGREEEALAALGAMGIEGAVIGEVVGQGGKVWLTAQGQVRTLSDPEPDPYWDAYSRAVRERWS
jgi:hydrogenase expression/formation protein HypE